LPGLPCNAILIVKPTSAKFIAIPLRFTPNIVAIANYVAPLSRIENIEDKRMQNFRKASFKKQAHPIEQN